MKLSKIHTIPTWEFSGNPTKTTDALIQQHVKASDLIIQVHGVSKNHPKQMVQQLCGVHGFIPQYIHLYPDQPRVMSVYMKKSTTPHPVCASFKK